MLCQIISNFEILQQTVLSQEEAFVNLVLLLFVQSKRTNTPRVTDGLLTK